MSRIFVGGQYKLSTKPEITINLSYEYKRTGNDMYYRFKVTVEPLTSASFAYDLRINIDVNGTKLLSGGKIKDLQPSKWTAAITKYFPAPSAWYKISGVTDETELPCFCRIYSSQTNGGASTSGQVVYVSPAEETDMKLYVKAAEKWHQAKGLYVKTGGTWHEAKGLYRKIDGIWKEV